MAKVKSASLAALGATIVLVPLAARPQTFTSLHSFNGDGEYPTSGLIYRDGFLYGATLYGGGTGCYTGSSFGCGTVFKVDPLTGAETVLYSFTNGADGGTPFAGLTYQGGILYGTTTSGGGANCFGLGFGCGTVFKLDPTTGAETVLYSFAGGADGANPFGALLYYGGALYGTTRSGGGASDNGTVFKVSPTTEIETVLYTFAGGSDGEQPSAGLIYEGGFLYGTTTFGGGTGCSGSGCGTVFKVDPATGAETVLYRFAGGADGANPYSTLLYYGGALYGTTEYGGGSGTGCYEGLGCGTIFKLDPATGAEKVLHTFTGAADGAFPAAGLIQHAGSLYGTASGGADKRGGYFCGGGNGCGTVFKVNPVTGIEKVLHRFTGLYDGGNPSAGLLYQAGTLYGTTADGGTGNCIAGYGCGTVFSLTP